MGEFAILVPYSGLPCPIQTSGNEAFIFMRGQDKFGQVGFGLMYNETKEINRTDVPGS